MYYYQNLHVLEIFKKSEFEAWECLREMKKWQFESWESLIQERSAFFAFLNSDGRHLELAMALRLQLVGEKINHFNVLTIFFAH